ncbi:hypothetical protein GGX14DRAFT_575326 [Mycena pura]|uniref:Uncharacterized protein n=1 Tax=Mycena pura TaxID=153505 RepID=A0AAD6UVE9_9AGAR|nr:hypothetical protein GGX14DRAFT_575326 [Mycena pura]
MARKPVIYKASHSVRNVSATPSYSSRSPSPSYSGRSPSVHYASRSPSIRFASVTSSRMSRSPSISNRSVNDDSGSTTWTDLVKIYSDTYSRQSSLFSTHGSSLLSYRTPSPEPTNDASLTVIHGNGNITGLPLSVMPAPRVFIDLTLDDDDSRSSTPESMPGLRSITPEFVPNINGPYVDELEQYPYNMRNAMIAFDAAVRDPSLSNMFHHLLGTVAIDAGHLTRRETFVHIITHHGNEQLEAPVYALRPSFAISYSRQLRALGSIILCAGNNNIIHAAGIDDMRIPFTLPRASYVEAGLVFPAIITCTYQYGTTEINRHFESSDDVLRLVDHIDRLICYSLVWIAHAMNVSHEVGLGSAWNWGAALGLFRIDYLARVRTYDPPSDVVCSWIKELVKSNDRELRAVDKACAAVLSEDGINEFILVDDGGTTHLWPRIKRNTIFVDQPNRVFLNSNMVPAYIAKNGL